MPADVINLIILIVVSVLLLVLGFIFSSMDMAFGCVNISHLERKYKTKPSKGLALAIKYAKDYDQTISTILLCNDIVNIASEVVSIPLSMYISRVGGFTNTALVTTLVAIITLILLIFIAEILAKSIGKIYSEKIVYLTSYFLTFFYYLFFPITYVTKKFISLVTYPITHKVKDIEITDDELHEMVDEIEEEGVVDEEKAEMIRSTIDYANTEAFEVMTPRVDVFAIDVEDSIDDILNNEEVLTHSRIPVYEDSIDNVIGYVHSKTLVRLKLEDKTKSIRDIILPLEKFPRSTEINDIFREFKKTQVHFAIVLDEYGGTEGIITMEDILEEIVGEIWDETDDIEAPYFKTKDGSYIVDGGMNLDDFFDLFELDKEELDDTEYVTIGGFCIELLDDRFAKVGEVLIYKNLKMKVLAIDENHTIEKLLIKIIKK
jgi:putative hemolysin